jgi:hypothetical protein
MLWFVGFNFIWPYSAEGYEKMIQKLTPLTGHWKTHSTYTESGVEAQGDLKIRWILGGQWLLIEFVGQHPKRTVWEAYALIKYDSKKHCYLSFSFFDENSPVTMTGSWITPHTVRFLTKTENGSSGIDYTIKKDGTIYQENWMCSDQGKPQILLKTVYRRK